MTTIGLVLGVAAIVVAAAASRRLRYAATPLAAYGAALMGAAAVGAFVLSLVLFWMGQG